MDRHVEVGGNGAKLVHRLAEPAPVSMAFMPRTMPSVATIAMQRTRPSPRCCCTSTMTDIGVGTSKPSETMRSA
jgi:hypothetical protein